jgi:hypothetical protein
LGQPEVFTASECMLARPLIHSHCHAPRVKSVFHFDHVFTVYLRKPQVVSHQHRRRNRQGDPGVEGRARCGMETPCARTHVCFLRSRSHCFGAFFHVLHSRLTCIGRIGLTAMLGLNPGRIPFSPFLQASCFVSVIAPASYLKSQSDLTHTLESSWCAYAIHSTSSTGAA